MGAGGREHALARVLGRSADVVVTPGNPGITGTTPEGHTIESVAARPEEIEADLTVIGPEVPLVDGLADRLRAAGKLVFGPGADGARLEGSKAFMKEVLAAAGVPTARFGVFDRLDDATAFLRTLPGPWVVKTDGLAAGKGVLVARTLEEATADVAAKLSGAAFGTAGRRVVIEEGLVGPECSLLVLCDGRRLAPLAPAQDFKRLEDGDSGPNTGGMGAYSPLPFLDASAVDRLVADAVEPLVGELRARGIDYRGVLYAGLMLTANGPRVLEFNVRFGDPEAQVVLPRYDGDLTALLCQVASGALRTAPRCADDAAVCVVLAAESYPGSPRIGDRIEGIEAAGAVDGVTVFHAGTRLGPGPGERPRDRPGGGLGGGGEGGHAGGTETRVLETAGGRVLDVTALGPTIAEARARAYRAVSHITWPGMHYRHDIAAASEDRAAPRAPRHGTPAAAPAADPTTEHEDVRR